MVSINDVKNDIGTLQGLVGAREGKYIRNLNRYNNNGARREDLWTAYSSPQAYIVPATGTEGIQTQLNVCKSVVDTVVSKISQAKVRPFFTPNGGSYETRKACNTSQTFFDLLIDDQEVYKKSVMALRDACVFDQGIIHIDPVGQRIDKINPWEYFCDPAEVAHGRISRVAYQRRGFPLIALQDRVTNDKLVAKFQKDGWFSKLFKQNKYTKGYYTIYYDLDKGYRYELFDHEEICEPIKLEFDRVNGLMVEPFERIYFNEPIRGFWGVSLIDDIYPIQKQVDELAKRLDAATRNGIFNIILLPNGSQIKPSDISNGAAQVIQYNPGADGNGVQVVTPPVISQQFIQLLEMYMQKAYELTGISMLSAQSKKPSGLDSGVALSTFEDIESDRWNTLLQNYVHYMVNIVRKFIAVMPANADILPSMPQRPDVKWSDIKKQKNLFTVQFSAASSLSKDPSTKIEQIKELSQMGVIDGEMVSNFLQLPDLQSVYSLSASSLDYCEKIISRTIETGKIDYVETCDLRLLRKLAVKRINQLEAADDDKKYIDRVLKLLDKVTNDMEILGGA